MNLPCKPPYEFTGPYGGCYSNRRMAMDERHVYVIAEILRNYRFHSALEIGSYKGASSTAFVEAINRGTLGRATFCDVNPTDELFSVVGNCIKPECVKVYPYPSTYVLDLPEEFDFVLVDANHDYNSVKPEVDRLLRRKPLCVVAHDTNADAAGYPRADGARYLKETFQSLDEYGSCEECVQRDGEETHRGLFIASQLNSILEVAQSAFAKWCPVEVAV